MSANAPSPECDCRQVAVRRIRLVAVMLGLVLAVVRAAAFAHGTAGWAACSFLVGVAILTYGAATVFDESATFPKWLYVAIALLGAGLTALWTSALVSF